ncbi:thioredoxin domain-containing protein [Bifidobacterium sp. ESL0690]|uniref:DsbA family protein n=1 Tax=Bifidobacterium sp. ESL0690 TaxID=2983214 RepID=UPI0023F9BE61|nr:thioredoxin domain-containing protein [Bifidobacterium sp. ESL0690]WEV46103.1 thioredoxin domain-containing protein [Bifidobacterium sp. ESL0690]
MATGNGQVNDGQKPGTTKTNTKNMDKNVKTPANKANKTSEKTKASALKASKSQKQTQSRTQAEVTQAVESAQMEEAVEEEEALETHDKIQQRHVIIVCSILAAILAVVIVVAGCYAYWDHKHGEEHNYQQLQQLPQKPTGMTKQGGLPAFKASDYNPKAPSVDLYVDFFCPGCSTVERGLSDSLQKMQQAKQINLYIHPVNFLDSKTKNHYSTRSASAFAYVSSHEPDKLLAFSTALFSKDYQPNKGNNREVSDQEIVKQALKAGVSKDVAESSTKGTYNDYVNKATKYTLRRKELYVHMQDEFRFSTPTICINGEMWHYRKLHTLQDIPPTFIHSVGLQRSQVGDPEVTPSIGPDGKALPIQQKYL